MFVFSGNFWFETGLLCRNVLKGNKNYFELREVRVIEGSTVNEGKITVNLRKKSRGNRLWFESEREVWVSAGSSYRELTVYNYVYFFRFRSAFFHCVEVPEPITLLKSSASAGKCFIFTLLSGRSTPAKKHHLILPQPRLYQG